jgi:gamma-glutamylcyclotransferase (GGCT)/AIG2-like uncharacterized protein YtfP
VTRRALFVYGTLKAGASNHVRVASSQRIVEARVRGRLYDSGKGWPVLIFGGETFVHGQVLFFDDLTPLLPALDEYEGFDPQQPERSLFVRTLRPVTLDGGEDIDAWVYEMPPAREEELVRRGAVLLSSGRW